MSTLPQVSDQSTEEELSTRLTAIRKKELEHEKIQEAHELGVEFIRLAGRPIASPTISLIPKETAQKYGVVAYFKDGNTLKLASLHPMDPEVQVIARNLGDEYNLATEMAMTSVEHFDFALKEYDHVPKAHWVGEVFLDPKKIEELTMGVTDFKEIGNRIHNVSLSDFLNLILAASIKLNASDIHFQPEEDKVDVRFRIDGVLHEIFSIKREDYAQTKKRIKLLAKLKLNIEDKPQDGGFTINLANERIDLRLSSLPTHFGESLVLRLLNPQAVGLELTKLGLAGQALAIVERQIKKPNGMIVSCGPTGSGKTTTLYTILKTLNHEDKKILTLENPIELKLTGIVQTQVDPKKLNFAEGLKAILRQDPDIIMVGEIRDLDTAETAVNAALTGHLVISTLHTNNAAGAIPRFLAMGVKPFLLAPSINIIISQRLIRRLCGECKQVTELPAELMQRAQEELRKLPQNALSTINLEHLSFYNSPGCDKCAGIGLKGRVGIFETLQMNEKINAAIQQGQITEYTILELAKEQGMVTIVQDGLLKALQGITTVEEVLRVAG